jgi:UDP-N-acetylmuramoyl-tripeptide--D-alanyl-D-alanine ligase
MMISLTLRDLENIPQASIQLPASGQMFEAPVRGISINTRTLQPREIFWAIKGQTHDGHWYVSDAEKKGAVAAVVEKKRSEQLSQLNIPVILVKDTLKSLQQFSAWHRKRFNIPVIAITGTNGKTTVKEMITWILQKKFKVHKTIGNLNNHIGTPLTLLHLNSDHEISVIELGTNHPGEIAKLGSLVRPTAALITNIGRGHLEFFSGIDGVAKEKISLFKSLQKSPTVFLNNDDERLTAASIKSKNIWSYSLYNIKNPRVKGRLIRMDKEGCGIWELNNNTRIHLCVPGVQNVQNALAASSVGLFFGLKENDIKEALEGYSAYDKRMQIIRNDQILIINDSYNANPDSFLPALNTLVHLASGKSRRKIIVIGDMLELGKKGNQLHRELFLQFLEYDVAAIFTIGQFSNKAADLVREKGYQNVYSFSEHEELAKKLKIYLKPGDTILLKGSRGMQMEKVLAYI